MTHEPTGQNTSRRIQELEGLRAYLAWWVVLSHILLFSGGQPYLVSYLYILGTGSLAVDIFIIISGFVIFYLLDNRQDSYKNYLGKRFFRLFPLFIFSCAFGYLLRPFELANMDYWELVMDPAGVERRMAIYQTVSDYFTVHVLSHLTMLHGLIPREVIPFAAMAFNPPGWSISLEWQFYLIAPLFFYLFFHTSNRFGLLLVAIVLLILSSMPPEFRAGSAFHKHAEFFLLGMLSYAMYKRASNSSVFVPVAWVMAVAIVFGEELLKNPIFIPVAIWLVFFSTMLSAESDLVGRGVKWLFINRPALWFGRMSFSTYLLHQPILYVFIYLGHSWFDITTPKSMMVFLFATVIPAVTLSSWLAYKVIEQPGIALGRRLFKTA